MDIKKIIIIVIAVVIFLVGGYFIFFNKKAEPAQNSEESTVAEEEKSAPTQEYAMVDVSYFASEIHDALTNINNAIITDSEEAQEQFATELERLDKSMGEIDSIESYIQSLSDDEYSALKEKCQAFSAEAKKLYENLKNENYVKEEGIILSDDIHNLFNDLSDEFNNLLEKNSDSETQEDTEEVIEETAAPQESEEEPASESDSIVGSYQLN